MSSIPFDLDTFLSDKPMGGDDTGYGPMLDESVSSSKPSSGYNEPGYEGKIDYRIRQLSYSSLTTLHSCPRKYQLYKLRSTHRTEQDEKTGITFAFGHVIGQAIQDAFAGLSEDEVIWKMFLMWDAELFARDDKLDKSFFSAVLGFQRLVSMRAAGFLSDYEIVKYEGKPACELSFCINFPDGFRYRGFVDAVLQHKTTGKVVVLECKTTGLTNINPATFKNSAQALGYSIVLDHIFPALSSYEVLYLIYQTKSREYTAIPFTKTYTQRALWIRELLLDIETIKMYEEAEIYPMHGESCVQFFRDCEYLQTCTLSTKYLTKPMSVAEVDKTEYQVNIGLADLLDSQLNKLELSHG